jgi:hypothetical protein
MGLKVELHEFLTSTPVDMWSVSRPCRFTSEKEPPIPILQGDSFGTRPKKMRISETVFVIQFNIL